MKVCVLWRRFRNVELQKRIDENVFDDAYDEALQHAEALKKAGHEVALIQWKKDTLSFYKELMKEKPDIVFNASSKEEVAFLEVIGIPFVGSGLDLVSTCKATRKKILAYHKIPTPKFTVIRDLKDINLQGLRFPLFVKPVRGRGSGGISDENIVESREALKTIAARIINSIKQPALVEEYIWGRELTVGLIGNGDPTVLPVVEIKYNGCKTNNFEHKMKDNEIIECPAKLSELELKLVTETAKKTFKALGARDYGRVDMILSEDGIPYVLELNTFAGLTMPEGEAHIGYMGYMARAAGLSATQFLNKILYSALGRYKTEENASQAV
jgi:D-alanine-D-alanine ligase